MSKKVLLTGISGQTASYMADYLIQNTDHIIVGGIRRTSQAILSNIQHLIGNPRFKLITMDLCDSHSINRVIEEEKPDYFLNFGAATFVADSWHSPALHMQTNAVAIIHILEAIRKIVPNCRVYSSGSSEQWGDVKYSPQDENHPMSPRSVYGASKCVASHICKIYRESYGLYVVHGILTNHESERRQEYFVTRKISKGVGRIHKALRQGEQFEPIYLGNIYSKRDWSHAADFVEGIWRMINQEVYNPELWGLNGKDLIKSLKEYVLSSNETHSVKEFVELAFAEAEIHGVWTYKGKKDPLNEVFVVDGFEDKVLVAIDPKFYRPAEVDLLHGDSTRARMELGWRPKISFNELVREMVKNDQGPTYNT